MAGQKEGHARKAWGSETGEQPNQGGLRHSPTTPNPGGTGDGGGTGRVSDARIAVLCVLAALAIILTAGLAFLSPVKEQAEVFLPEVSATLAPAPTPAITPAATPTPTSAPTPATAPTLAQSSGELYIWGGDNHGQFGNGITESSPVPMEIPPAGI